MISLGQLPPRVSEASSGSDIAQLKLWLSSALEHHNTASSLHLKKQFASLEDVVVQNINRLRNDLLGNRADKDVTSQNTEIVEFECSPSEVATIPTQTTHKKHRLLAADTHTKSVFDDMAFIDAKVQTLASKSDLDECDLDEPHENVSMPNINGMTWEDYHKAIDHSLLGKVVASSVFDVFVAFAIVASAVVTFVELQWYGEQARVALGLQSDDTWGAAKSYFALLEHTFNIIFLLELVARFIYLRKEFLKDGFVVLDLILITSTSIHLYILVPLDVRSGARATVFRLIRLTRLVRVLRFVRVMALCAELRVLVNTCVSCIQALVWSMIFLGIIMVCAGLFLTQLVQENILDPNIDMETRLWAYRYYGSAVRSIYSLFEITFSGSWPMYFRPLVEKVNVGYSIFAIAYISIVVFALIRIITAIFLKETLRVASADSQLMINEQARTKKEHLKRIAMVFKAMDIHGEGKLTVQELHDPLMLVRFLADSDGYVTYEDFVQGVIRLRGQAREIDVIAILHSEDKVREMLETLLGQMEQVLDMLPKNVRRRGSATKHLTKSVAEMNKTVAAILRQAS